MISILIDAENVNPVFAEQIFAKAEQLEDIDIRSEIYGTAQALANWAPAILKYAINANLTVCASKGKNTSDIALVIGAMDLIDMTDTFLVASSDSDFSTLALRIRKAHKRMIGLGTEKANPLWMQACSEFVTLIEQDNKEALRQLVANEIAQHKDENGWAYLGDITLTLKKTIPAFSPANYGFRSVTPLVVSLGFEAEKRRNGPNVLMYVREKPAAEVAASSSAFGAASEVVPNEADKLREAGFQEGEIEKILNCFTLMPDMRKVFNAMRKQFGGLLGKEYYNQAKKVLAEYGCH